MKKRKDWHIIVNEMCNGCPLYKGNESQCTELRGEEAYLCMDMYRTWRGGPRAKVVVRNEKPKKTGI